MMSGVMRTSVSPFRFWRMTSWPAAKGMRCVKPSIAIVSPSRTWVAIASFSDRNSGRAISARGLASAADDHVDGDRDEEHDGGCHELDGGGKAEERHAVDDRRDDD